MRILIVEDENKTAAYLKKGLSESGFIVDIATNGEDGLYLATHHHYDLIVLDVMLPKVSGWSIIVEIRRMYPDARVLFLTARDDVEDKVKGFELGADDYLVKPFAFSELLARIRSLLRRGTTQLSDNLCISDLTIDILKHKATRNSQRLNLTPKEFALLVMLAQREGEVLSRTLIAESVWDINFDSDTNVVDVAIRRLRQKVDDPFEKKLIHTVRGMGYVFEER
ncbi:MAG: heavy metal response regulator transcription factor [Gammaproteobacteria bacterium]|nr:heavy metal response regulator transcription factor [Gammaproteobacteria bacterium]MCW5583057.1 heavy metal response regulator transcription factor [Gammaproteobacteria bacterium]